jgi:endonuclease/exonuclease/phosphatase (EEP) superfamily protein YafD
MLILFRRAVGGLAAGAVVVIALLLAALAVLRPGDGVFAILQVLSPHLAIAGLVAVPFVALLGRRSLGLAAVLLGVVVLARFGGEWLSVPSRAPAGALPVTVVTWNLEVNSRPPADTVALLRDQGADVIVLQEIQPRVERAIEADEGLTSRYPYRRFAARNNVLGLGVLSRFPIVSDAVEYGPAVQRVELDAAGRRLVVVNVHPMRGRFAGAETRARGIGLDVARRNRDLVTIRSIVDDAIATGASVVLAGDTNTASSEPAFDRLVDGLRDVHREVGLGPGWTWRPIRLEPVGFGLIRIDVVVGSPDTTPLDIRETCPHIGDHCLVRAELALPSVSIQAAR